MNLETEYLMWKGRKVIPNAWLSDRAGWKDFLERNGLRNLSEWLVWAKRKAPNSGIHWVFYEDLTLPPVFVYLKELELASQKVKRVTYR